MSGRGLSSERCRPDWRFWVGAALTGACLTWLAVTMDWPAVGSALGRVDLRWAVLAMVVNLASVLLRAIRWRTLFSHGPRPAWRRLVTALLVGQAGNLLLPARLGDAARASVVAPGNVPLVLGTIITEVALDLLMLAGLVVFLLARLSLPRWWRVPGQTTVFSALAALLLLLLLMVFRKRLAALTDAWAKRSQQTVIGRVLDQISRFLDGLSQLTLGALFWAAAASVLVWLLYAGVNSILLPAVGQRPSVTVGLFVLAVLLVGVAVPSSPGRIGVFHYLCIQALGVFGVDRASALSYAIVLHLISVVVPALLGALLAWSLGLSLGRSGNRRQPQT
jgi:uncharacterized protein (TIRG00374 family)